MAAIVAKRLKKFESIKLENGSHTRPQRGLCAMEAAAYIAGEPHSDAPQCVCPVIAKVSIALNDNMDTETRNRVLKPLIVSMIGTRDRAKKSMRAWMMIDADIREMMPLALSECPSLAAHVTALRALAPVIDDASLKAAKPVVEAAIAAAKAEWEAVAAYAYAYASASAYASAYAYAYASASAYTYAYAYASASAYAYAYAYAYTYAYAYASASASAKKAQAEAAPEVAARMQVELEARAKEVSGRAEGILTGVLRRMIAV